MKKDALDELHTKALMNAMLPPADLVRRGLEEVMRNDYEAEFKIENTRSVVTGVMLWNCLLTLALIAVALGLHR